MGELGGGVADDVVGRHLLFDMAWWMGCVVGLRVSNAVVLNHRLWSRYKD